MDIFTVKSPGSLTTVQDLGRFGFLDRGVPPSGALDSFACRVANLLVGNDETMAVLEITVMGPVLEATAETDIAMTGAEMGMTINRNLVPSWQTVRVKAGDVIRMPQAKKGCRAYLAVSGGFDVPIVMGSRSTFARAGFGGMKGRALVKGDTLKRGAGILLKHSRRLPDAFIPAYQGDSLLRAIPGPQDDSFKDSLESFFIHTYQVSAESDRMGCRLWGPPVEHDAGKPQSIVTEPVVPGNIQIPADGRPIILLVEQTSGGYSKIATVVSADMGKVAQAMPGSSVKFERVSLSTAHLLYREEEKRMQIVRELLR